MLRMEVTLPISESMLDLQILSMAGKDDGVQAMDDHVWDDAPPHPPGAQAQAHTNPNCHSAFKPVLLLSACLLFPQEGQHSG